MIHPAPMRAARGVSLIEVMVAVLIFSLGLLGLALMQLKGATFTKESGARTMAILEARSLADRMQANLTALSEYVSASSSGTIPAFTACSPTCSPTTVADNDVAEWLTQIKANAPAATTGGGYGKVTANADGSYTITVSWNGLITPGAGNGTGTSNVTESMVFIPDLGS